MSMVLCSECGGLIDSDDDPDCFVEVGNMRRQNETKVYCQSCRECNMTNPPGESPLSRSEQSVREPRAPKPTSAADYIRDLSEQVYRIRLEQDCDTRRYRCREGCGEIVEDKDDICPGCDAYREHTGAF